MSDPLVTYVDDHLAGAKFAIELLEELRTRHRTEPLGCFASELLTDVESDTAVLQDLATRLGSTNRSKKISAWLAEKVSRAKLRHDGESLGTFEALELVSLGIQGKLALWGVLASINQSEVRLHHLNLPELISRAEAQYIRAEKQRLACAPKTFLPERG